MRWSLLCLLLLLAGPAWAGSAALELVSNAPELAGLQVQRPVWAPGETPRLVHEATDRSHRGFLRVVTLNMDSVLVPAARSSRLAAMGVGVERADTAAAWWDASGFFFVRSSVSSVSAHFWDGVLRDLAVPAGRPTAIVQDGEGLLVTMEDAAGLDLFRFSNTDLAGTPRRLTATRDEVEHSVTKLSDGRLVFIAASQEQTRLVLLGEGGPEPVPLSVQVELLSLAPLPDGRLLAWARGSSEHHVLLVLDLTGKATTLATDGFLPPGLAPRPAVSSSGWVYYVRSDASAGNPIVRLSLDGGPPEVLQVPTNGHQEVAVHTYPDQWGRAADWLAVVAVGDPTRDDVTNHLFIGPVSGSGGTP